jgi:pyruvate dehydrogenase E2 component (dihydrolipoamide acetyltransferase)
MEALSPTMEEGRLVKWLKHEGDAVKSGETLAEVETDKAVMELVARGEGVLRKQLVSEGSTTPVGQLLAVIAAPDENIDSLVAGASKQQTGEQAAPAAAEAPKKAESAPTPPASATGSSAPAPASAPATGQAGQASAQGDGDRTRSSPLARRLASEKGLDLGGIEGSGPGGRIIKRDIEAAMAGGGAGAQAQAAPQKGLPAPQRASREQPYRDVPLSQMRKTIAKRLSESIGPVPTFYLTAEFDLERAAEMRTAMADLGDAYKVSFNDVILKAVATALTFHPEVNAHWLGDKIRYHNEVHLGMAVAVEDGLITPVIFNADLKRLSEIARESRELAGRARNRRLKPDEYTGATFSVSNLGMFGIDHFTAIINPPETGILAIGAVEERPVVIDGELVIRKRLRVTMSCDHRVVDGATGSKFLQTLGRMLENPLLLVY